MASEVQESNAVIITSRCDFTKEKVKAISCHIVAKPRDMGYIRLKGVL